MRLSKLFFDEHDENCGRCKHYGYTYEQTENKFIIDVI